MTPPRLLLCGNLGGTNIGESFLAAAGQIGCESRVVETSRAFTGPKLVRQLTWHLLGRRPPVLLRYNRWVRAELEQFRPDLLLTTGVCPVTAETLISAGKQGIRTANYSTDDPWNPAHRTRRFLRSVPVYDLVFTPRRANYYDFIRVRAREVRYLPFGYDPRFWFRVPMQPSTERPDVLFVGGADRDRIPLLRALVQARFRVRIHGSYWDRDAVTRSVWAGQVGPDELRSATCAAEVNLILVRRANRDGHVMRSFEAAACGGCLLVEDTPEHREIFADTVTYFRTKGEMTDQMRGLLDDPDRRGRLAEASHRRVTAGARNTYAQRLRTILERAFPT